MASREVPSEQRRDVFINFRGKELRGGLISHLVAALDATKINYYIDRDELRGEPLDVLFERIEECKIALTIFSSRYGESNWCLNELGKIMRRVDEGNLKVIPIFFNVTPDDVALQLGDFGTNLLKRGRDSLPEMVQWRKYLTSVVNHMGMELSKYPDEHTFKVHIIIEVKRVLDSMVDSMVDSKITPPQIQVFINSRGDQLCRNFVGYLMDALQTREVNVFIEQGGEEMNTLFKRIEDSGIAIVVFSTSFTESKWCLEELVKIKERVQKGLLNVLPIFYKVSPTAVKRLKGEFGDHFRNQEYNCGCDSPQIKAWKEAILFATETHGLVYDEYSGVLEIDFVETIAKEVLKMLQSISIVESGQSSR